MKAMEVDFDEETEIHQVRKIGNYNEGKSKPKDF